MGAPCRSTGQPAYPTPQSQSLPLAPLRKQLAAPPVAPSLEDTTVLVANDLSAAKSQTSFYEGVLRLQGPPPERLYIVDCDVRQVYGASGCSPARPRRHGLRTHTR